MSRQVEVTARPARPSFALQLHRTRRSSSHEPLPRAPRQGPPAPRSTRCESALSVTLPALLSLPFVSSPHVLHARKPREALWAHDLSIQGNASSNYRTPAVHRAGPPPRTDRNSGCWYSKKKKKKIRAIHKTISPASRASKIYRETFRKITPDQRSANLLTPAMRI